MPTSLGNSISYALEETFLKILHGRIFFLLSLLYVPLGNLSFLKCTITKSPSSRLTSLRFKFALALYFRLLSCYFCFTSSCSCCLELESSSPSTLLFNFSYISQFMYSSRVHSINNLKKTLTCASIERVIICIFFLCQHLIPLFWMITNQASK